MKKFSLIFLFSFTLSVNAQAHAQEPISTDSDSFKKKQKSEKQELRAYEYTMSVKDNLSDIHETQSLSDEEINKALKNYSGLLVRQMKQFSYSIFGKAKSANCTARDIISTKSEYFSKSCNQLDGAVVNSEDNEVLSMSKFFLNNSIEILSVSGNKEECKKCFQNKVKDTKNYNENEVAIAKEMILSLNEKKIEKEIFNLAGLMESMTKQNAIRGSSVDYILDKRFGSDPELRKEKEDQLNCRSSKVISEKVASKCSSKSINVEEVLNKVLPGNKNHAGGTFMEKLYSNASTLESSLCKKSGFKSVGNYQKVQSAKANNGTETAISKARDSFHSLIDKIVQTDKARDALCNGANKVDPKLFIRKLVNLSIQKDSLSIQELNIDITDSISPFVSAFNKFSQKNANKTINFETEGESREELINSFLDLSTKADPINEVLLSDSKFICDFALSKKSIKDYLQFNKRNESIDDFHSRQFAISEDYSSQNCEPILEKISSLVCGENFPDFEESNSYKEYLKENFNAEDLRKESVRQFRKIRKKSNPDIVDVADSEIPALAGLNCEVSSSVNNNLPSVYVPFAFVDRNFPNDDLQDSDFLTREMKKSLGVDVYSHDGLELYEGIQACLGSLRTLDDIELENAFYGKDINIDDVRKTAADQYVNSNYKGEIPKNIRDIVRKKRAQRNGSLIATKDNSIDSYKVKKPTTTDNEETKTTAFSEFAKEFTTPDDISPNKDFSSQYAAYRPTIPPSASELSDVEPNDVAKVLENPEALKDYNNWKTVKAKNEEGLKKRIAELTKKLNRAKRESASSDQDDISNLEKEIATLDSSLKRSKAQKYAVNKNQGKSTKQFKTAKNTNNSRNQISNDSSGSNSFSTSSQGGGGRSSNPVKRSIDRSSSANSSGYLVLQTASDNINSLFTDKINNEEWSDIDVKYGADDQPLYVKIPGKTLYVPFGELSKDLRALILSTPSLSRVDKEAIALKESKKGNKFGRKIASVDESSGDVSRLEDLKDVTNMKMLEFARDLNDTRLVKFYLKRIKKMNPVMYELVK